MLDWYSIQNDVVLVKSWNGKTEFVITKINHIKNVVLYITCIMQSNEIRKMCTT